MLLPLIFSVSQFSSHHLVYAHFGPLPVEARLAGRAEPAGRSLAQAGILVAPCNGNAEAAVTLVIYQFGNLRGEKIKYPFVSPELSSLRIHLFCSHFTSTDMAEKLIFEI